MRKFNRFITAAMCSSMMIPAGAYAQAAQSEEAAKDENIIIVTANQRASNVQDIPIAVTAVTPVQLERQGIQDIRTLGAVSASFNLQSSQTESQGTSIRLRGVGTTGNNIGLESAVGVFIDGVYQSRPGVALGDLVDLEQLEVLRGPQGTLFGRNTTAGALVVRTKRPNLNEVEGFGSASYGNFDSISLQGGVSAPLVQDTLGVRVTGAYRKRDGFLQNVTTGEDTNNRDRYLVRGQLLWEPSADISLRLIGDYQKTNEECCDAVTVSVNPSLSAALRTELFQNRIGFDEGVDARISAGNGVTNDVRQWGVSAEFKWDLGGAEFTYIGAYRDFLGENTQDEFQGSLTYSVGGVTDGIRPPNFDDIKTSTHEARLQGAAFGGVVDWLVGAFYSKEDIEEVASLTLGRDFQRVVGTANLGNAGALGSIAGAGAYFASGSTNPATFAPLGSTGAFAQNRFTQEGESFSVFTHNIFNISDTFNITLGARYVDETKVGVFDQLAANNPACLASVGLAGALGADRANGTTIVRDRFAFSPALQGLVTNAAAVNGGAFLNCFPFAAPALGQGFLPREFNQTFQDDEFIYTGQVSWKPTGDLLIYGGFTHGFKSGGFNLDSTAAASGGNPSFLSEEIDAFELGLKSTLFDGRARANIAFFHSSLDNFQVLEFTGTQFQTYNVDDVTSKGVEVEFAGNWTDNFSTNVAVTYTDAAYGRACDATFRARGGPNPAVGLCGTSLTNAPEWTGIVGATYDGPLSAGGWGLLANVNARYESSRRTSTVGNLVTAGVVSGLVPFDVQKANVKLNARLGFTTPNEKFTFEIWGNNLTDEVTRSITFNTPLLGAGARSAFIEDPRTYGLTVRTKF